MQDSIGFQQPTRLGIHKIRQRASRQRHDARLNHVATHTVHRRRLTLIDQRVAWTHGQLRLKRRKG